MYGCLTTCRSSQLHPIALCVCTELAFTSCDMFKQVMATNELCMYVHSMTVNGKTGARRNLWHTCREECGACLCVCVCVCVLI